MKFTFEMVCENQLWTVTSGNIPGLLAAGHTAEEALAKAGTAMTDLAFACALEQMQGHQVRPPFRVT